MIILSETMPKRWIQASPIDDERPADSFPVFPKVLPDPGGRLDSWLEQTTVVPLCALEWKCKQGWRVGPRVLNDTLWFWFENGGGWYRLDKGGPRKPFRAGDLLLIPQGREHTVQLDQGGGVRHLSVHFHAHVFGNISLLTLLGFPSHVPATVNSPFGEASANLAREYAVQAPGWQRAMADTIFLTLLHIVRHDGHLFRPLADSLHQLLPRLLPALEWIEQKLNDPDLAIGDLARKVGVSEVYLRKLFRQATGIGPAAFIQRRRVEQACRLLRLTSKSVKTIAAETGFQELTFFYRVFGRWTRTTPARYRAGNEENFSCSRPAI